MVSRALLGLTAAAALIATAAPASADVRITADEVVVSSSDARVIAKRKPFRLSFQTADGREVLRQVDPTGVPGAFVAPDPVPSGLAEAPERELYAPLAFTVGAERDTQYPGFFYGGNRLIGMRGGVQHHATEVLSARADGDAAVLELATTDPTGRRLSLTLRPEAKGGANVSARPVPADGVVAMADAFVTGADEAFHGFGGRHNAIDQRGQAFYNWIEQENQSAGPLQPLPDATGPAGSGGEKYLFPNGQTAAYHVQNLFVSSRPYGFLLDRPELSRWRMASDRSDAWRVGVTAQRIDYVVAPGAAPRAIEQLTAITGRHRVPPEWAVGPQFDRAFSVTRDNLELAREDLAMFDKTKLPVTGYRYEAAAEGTGPGTKQLFKDLRARGIMPLVYFNPYLDPVDGQFGVKGPTGEPYLFPTGNVPAYGGLLDVTDPKAVAFWQARITGALEAGAEGFMQDFGEATQMQMRFANGEDGTTMHNKYPVIYHRITREAIDRFEKTHPGREIFFYTRSGFSGRQGSVAHDNANFPGDETSDWMRSAGIKSIAPDMLNRGLGGATGFTTDIGGYLDTNAPPTTKELFLRWSQWGALSPLFRLHGTVVAGTHAPWTFDDDTVEQYRALSNLHLRARPLIMQLWREAERTGMPIARPLWLVHPEDAKGVKEDQQWLLGNDVLVAPVVDEGARSRSVHFPPGCWERPDTGQRHSGPSDVKIDAPLNQLPWFVRCGTDPLGEAKARVALRNASACTSRRAITIRLPRPPRGDRLRAARVRFAGRNAKVVRGTRWKAIVDLRRLAPGRYVVRVNGRTAKGRRVHQTRVFRTCAKRARSHRRG